MSASIETQEKHKWHLHSLLKIKKANEGITIAELQAEIQAAVALMVQEDVAWVEKVVGIKAF